MRADIVRFLRCPVCHGALTPPQPTSGAAPGGAGPLRCAHGHSFDQARQGYAHLSAGPLAHTGDSAAMVDARVRFLGAGHYRFIADALAGAARSVRPPGAGPGELVVDVGAGTGYHLAAVLDALPDALGLALDASKPALRRAARAHPRADAAACDVWRALPVADGTAALVLNVFAPRNGPEFRRVLAPGGAVLVVTPTPRHLAELARPLGLLTVDPAKESRVAGTLMPWLNQESERGYEQHLLLHRAEVATLVGMGPSARHLDEDALLAGIAELPEPVAVTASVRLGVYRAAG